MRTMMRGLIVVFAVAVLWPADVFAQASGIAGVVKDATGAVMPGVTVEATSDALIERVRTVTTDSQGQYKIVDLRPGVYTVTFTLAGFQPQTVPVSPIPPSDPRDLGPGVRFDPSPVFAQLEPVPPPTKGKKKAAPRPAKTSTAPQ